MSKNCLYCNQSFEPKTETQKYCKASHKVMASQKRSLKGIVTATDKLTVTETPTRGQLPVKLDAISDFIIDQLKRERDLLTEKIKKQETIIENLTEERNSLREDSKELQGQLEEKPRGLMGFAKENPDLIKEGLSMALPLLSGLLEKIATPKQLGEVPGENNLINWIKTQPLDIQNAITQLLDGVMKSGKPMDYLNHFNKSFRHQRAV